MLLEQRRFIEVKEVVTVHTGHQQEACSRLGSFDLALIFTKCSLRAKGRQWEGQGTFLPPVSGRMTLCLLGVSLLISVCPVSECRWHLMSRARSRSVLVGSALYASSH